MDPLHMIVGQIDWASKNMAYNYDFIPDDKLSWKPAPEANSAFEIAAHVATALTMFATKVDAAISDAPAGNAPDGNASAGDAAKIPMPQTRDEAKQIITDAAQKYIAVLQKVRAEDLNKNLDMRFGTFPLSFLIGMPATDVIHHHGQIAYLQTMLGDTDTHFDMSLLPS